MKNLIRLKTTLGNVEAERLIGALGDLLEVTLKPAEMEALELERQLLMLDNKLQSRNDLENTSGRLPCTNSSTQTDWYQVNCYTQTPFLLVASKEVQVRLPGEKETALGTIFRSSDSKIFEHKIVRMDIEASGQTKHGETQDASNSAQVTLSNEESSRKEDEDEDQLEEVKGNTHSEACSEPSKIFSAELDASDQQVRVSCTLVNSVTYQPSSRVAVRLPRANDAVQFNQEVLATYTSTDTASLTSSKGQQHVEGDITTCTSSTKPSSELHMITTDDNEESQFPSSCIADSGNVNAESLEISEERKNCLSNDDDLQAPLGIAECNKAGKKHELFDQQLIQTKSPKLTEEQAPLSLIDCIPTIQIDDDKEDPVSPTEGILVPRKKEKRVSFVDQDIVEPAHDSSDERLMREVEMIFAEMRHPDTIRELSPLPPSPISFSSRSTKHISKKKKRHRDKETETKESGCTQQSRKRLAHQNPTGFDAVLTAPPHTHWSPRLFTTDQEQYTTANFGFSSLENATSEIGRLKAEVAHNSENGMTTFSFQIPSGGNSRICVDFDQMTRKLELSCQTPTATSNSQMLMSGRTEHHTSCAGDVTQIQESPRRPSLGFSVPFDTGELQHRSPNGVIRQSPTLEESCEIVQQEEKGEEVELALQGEKPFAQESTPLSERSDGSLQREWSENQNDNQRFGCIDTPSYSRVTLPKLSSEPTEIAQPCPLVVRKTLVGAPLTPLYPSILKMDRRLKRLSKHKKGKYEKLVNDMHKKCMTRSMSKSIYEAKKKMMQRQTGIDRKNSANSSIENCDSTLHLQRQSLNSTLVSSKLGEASTFEPSSAAISGVVMREEINDESIMRNVNANDQLECSEEPSKINIQVQEKPLITGLVNKEQADTSADSANADQSETRQITKVKDTISEHISAEMTELSDAAFQSEKICSVEKIDILNGMIDPPPLWSLKSIDGKFSLSPAKENRASDSDSDQEMCIEVEDMSLGPMSPDNMEIVDRSLAKLIPTEFDEDVAQFVYGSTRLCRSRKKDDQEVRVSLLPPPPPSESPTQSPISGSTSVATRRMSKIIPNSPVQKSLCESTETTPRRTSPRISSRQGKFSLSPTKPLNIFSLGTTKPAKKVSLLKDSYVVEKEDHVSNKLFGYDDTTISATQVTLNSICAEAQSSDKSDIFKHDKVRGAAEIFKNKDYRSPQIENIFKRVAEDGIGMDAVVSSLVNESQLRKIYVSVIHVLIDINCKLDGGEEQVSTQEKNLVDFLLKELPSLRKFNGKPSSAIAVSCITFIRAYLMSPTGSMQSVLELSSVLKALALVAQDLPSERRHLLDEAYYFIADRTGEAAYLICCFLAAWPQSLSQIGFDSPFGFVLRYILYHHSSAIPKEDLQKARMHALRSGWRPLPPTGVSLAEAIERYNSVVFERRAGNREISRLALQAMELLLTIQRDPCQARVVFEGNVRRLLAAGAGCSQREVNSLLQLCGRVWKKFSAHNVAEMSFEATVEELIGLIGRLGPGQEDTKDLCRKALWLYASYDKNSEWSFRAKQHSVNKSAKNKQNKIRTKNYSKYNKDTRNNKNKSRSNKGQIQQQKSASCSNTSPKACKRTIKKAKHVPTRNTKVSNV
ncbi:hypothetical protein BIW11_07798 [Tropilaelaps mercedesae]|uniref:Uncharacterized protein n=1 Tax=Tropilaelaps mercedesae TaxID=418985 RepID=A0A1V9XSG6_9ACAR|nr:hypothetical protein BIW11_07798 [Tropilaelaps mercedesae]